MKIKLPILLTFLILHVISFAQKDSLKPLDIRLTNYAYPFPVQFINLKIQQDTLQMAYMDVRPVQANGKVIILLHGKNFNGAYWEQTARRLLGNGYRVIIPDQIGFGKSSKPLHLQYSFQLLAENTKNLLDTLNVQQVTVLGHSMGGMLATRFALMYPERARQLILVNPIGLEDWKVKVPYQSVDDWYQTELKQNYDAIKKYQQENYYHNTWKPEYGKWVIPLAGWALHEDYEIIAWNSALTYDMVFTQPVIYEFDKITAPTLLIIGQLDRTALGKNLAPEEIRVTLGNYPALGIATAQKIKNTQLVELDGVGHLPHIEAFNQFITPLLQFLKR